MKIYCDPLPRCRGPTMFAVICLTAVFMYVPVYSLYSDYGEPCENADECIDHRFACVLDEADNKTKCRCDRYHEWKGEHLGCYPIYDAVTLIKMVVKSTDNTEKREKELQRIFVMGPLMGGLTVLIVTVLCGFSVMSYCFHIRKRDNDLKLLINEYRSKIDANNEAKKGQLRPSTSLHV